MSQLSNSLRPGFTAAAICDVVELHGRLGHWNHQRLAPGAPDGDWEAGL